MAITQDSTRALTVTKREENESYVKMYSLQTQELTFEEKIGGGEDQYIKVKEIEQNPNGQLFAVVYFDDGLFRLRVFGRVSRTPREIEESEVKINELIGIDNSTMVNEEFVDPYITCCWIGEYRVFVNFFHNYTRTHYHFIWDIRLKRMIGEPQVDAQGRPMFHDKPIKIKINSNH